MNNLNMVKRCRGADNGARTRLTGVQRDEFSGDA